MIKDGVMIYCDECSSYTCGCPEAKEIESLRQQLASRDAEVATLNEHIEYMLSRDKTWADIDSLKEQQLASRDAEIATLKGTVNEIQAARHVQREHNDLLVKNHKLREQVTELQGQVGLLLRISKELAATEPK